MKYLFFLFFVMCLNSHMIAQPDNLVLNPGFEKQEPGSSYPPCSYASKNHQFDQTVSGWNTWKGMTPDYIHWEGNDYGPCFFPKPHRGDHALGMITYLPALDLGKLYDYHEYVYGRLRFPLEPGQAYKVELFIQQAEEVAIDHLEIMYGEKQEIIPVAAGNLGICFLYNEPRWLPKDGFSPQILFKDPIVTNQGEWKKLSATFVADRDYLFFVIGNFFKDVQTRTNLVNEDAIVDFNTRQTGFAEKKKRIAYYLLDDISVQLTQRPTTRSIISEALTEKKIYTFKNVHFKTGKWDLQPEALPELQALAEFLRENPDQTAEIAGHTDDVGKEQDNRILSEKRAEAVYQYLVFKGVPPNRITFRGYGESEPVETNETAAGRRENRRVECRVENE